jgi:hypothetical protein
MFITLKYPTHQEQIPILSIVRFATIPYKIIITLSEVDTMHEPLYNIGLIKNKVVEIPQESQLEAFSHIQEYLKSNSSL